MKDDGDGNWLEGEVQGFNAEGVPEVLLRCSPMHHLDPPMHLDPPPGTSTPPMLLDSPMLL